MYTAENPPTGYQSDFILRELQRIGRETELPRPLTGILLPTLHAEPARPREGLVVLADGTDWNPGSGAGFYGYHSGAWTFLG